MSNPLHWGAAQRVSSMSPDESVRSNNSNNFSATAHCLSRRGSFHWARERGITQRWNRNPAIDKAAESTEQDNEIETRTYDCHPCIWLIRCFWRSGFRTTEDEGRDLAVRPRTGGRPHRRGEAETFVLVHARRTLAAGTVLRKHHDRGRRSRLQPRRQHGLGRAGAGCRADPGWPRRLLCRRQRGCRGRRRTWRERPRRRLPSLVRTPAGIGGSECGFRLHGRCLDASAALRALKSQTSRRAATTITRSSTAPTEKGRPVSRTAFPVSRQPHI